MEFNKAYNRQEFVNFLQNSFLPDDFIPMETPVEFRTKLNYTTQAVKLGSSGSLDLVVYEVRHNSKNDARVSLSKEAFRLLADEMEDRALVLFVPEDNSNNYRFSLIEITLEAKDDSSRVTRNYSNPRRYSYFLGEGIAYYTPNKYLNEKGRVVSPDDLRSRFSVEVLTKEFYQELSDWYAWAIKIIRFPNDLNDKTDDDKFNNESAIRLITRLIFVWFLKQRHLIPDEFFDEKYIAQNLIKDFNPHVKIDLFYKSDESRYYKAILQNLFFAMLNSPITPEGSIELSERHFRNGRGDYDNNKLMRYEAYFKDPQLFVDLANHTVPFLNGGLFDCLDEKDKNLYYDGFSDRGTVKKALIVPDYLFFGEEVGKDIDLSEWYGDKKKKKVSARGIIDILKRYNFTVEENTPFDQEVSLDPELLGKVFENLLASYNPETQTTARKQTGSFYTPREIVQYMVDESLVAHLKRTVGDDLEAQYRQLMQYTDEAVDLTEDQRKQIMQSLYNCKVLDPACGSGAFPMGMLQQMVHIFNRIDPDNEMWKEMMLNVAINETSEAYRTASSYERREMVADIERSFDESVNRPDYARKLYLIENCIYGVDIQPIAIQISKLRFFISLVVDQKTNDNPAENFGIRPLPNLEAKFVAANTLISLEKKDVTLFDSDAIRAKKEELKIAKHKIFGAKTVKTKRKYRQIVNDLRLEIANMLEDCGAVGNAEAQQLASWDMFDQNSYSSFFDPEWMFDVKEGFDIVIGNPPYISHDSIPTNVPRKSYNVFEPYADIYCYFFEAGINLIGKGSLCFITSNSYLRANYGLPLRLYLHTNSLGQIIDIEDSQIFESAIVNVAITFVQKERNTNDCVIVNVPWEKDNFNNYVMKNKFLYKQTDFDFQPWTLIRPEALCVREKIEKAGTSLEHLHVKIRLGLATGDNSVFIIDEDKKNQLILLDKKNAELIKPVIRGQDIKRYIHLSSRYIILSKNGINIPKDYPTLYNYFYSFGEKFKKRGAKGKHWTNLRACSFFDDFLKDKIIWIELTDKGRFSYSSKEEYLLNSAYFLIPPETLDSKYLLGILNSRLIQVYMTFIAATSGMGTLRWINNYVKQFPIPTTKKESQILISNTVDKILEMKQSDPYIDTTILEFDIDKMVYHLYGLTYDEVLTVDPQTPITREEYERIELE